MESEIVDKIRDLIIPSLKKNMINLFGIEFVKQGKETILQILIEKEDGSMDLSTCVFISNIIGELLDLHDFIENEYTLEVSSPGAERPILSNDDYVKAIGKHIRVTLKNPIKDLSEISGDLINFENETLSIQYRNKTAQTVANIHINNVIKANLAVKFK